MKRISRIVVIHDSIVARGGATALARLSARLYRSMGYDVTYITGEEDDSSLDADGIQVVSTGSGKLLDKNRLSALRDGIYCADSAKIISEWIDRHDSGSTAYHLHNWAQSLSPSIFDAIHSVQHKTVMTCHDLFNVCPNGGLIHFGKGHPCQLKPLSLSCLASQCDRRNSFQKYWRVARHLQLRSVAKFRDSKITFSCLHQGMEELMRNAGFAAKNLTHVPNPAQAYTDERVDAENQNEFLFIGRLTQEKGIKLAIDAALTANVPLTVIGEGQLARQLDTQSSKIKFVGFQQTNEISQYAKRARALIFPSLWPEPYGLVVAEAALSGIPVIVSKQTLLSSAIEDYEMGVSFDTSVETDLARKLSIFESDDNMVQRLSLNAFKYAQEICSTPQRWAEKHVAILNEKLNS